MNHNPFFFHKETNFCRYIAKKELLVNWNSTILNDVPYPFNQIYFQLLVRSSKSVFYHWASDPFHNIVIPLSSTVCTCLSWKIIKGEVARSWNIRSGILKPQGNRCPTRRILLVASDFHGVHTFSSENTDKRYITSSQRWRLANGVSMSQ